MKELSWKKGLFQCAYQLLSGKEKVGELRPNRLTLSATGKLGDKRYYFKVREGLHNRVEIIDMETREQVGVVRFNKWLPKAKIDLKGKTYHWKFSNLFETKWKMIDSDQNSIDYKGWNCSGSLKGEIPAALVSLTGLFISTYYWQMNAIYVAIFILPLSFLIT